MNAREGITKDEQMKLNCIGSNQNEATLGNGTVVFFSYSTPVAAFFEYKYYRTDKKWSVTTSKHINRWLNGTEAEERPQAWFDSLAS